MTAKTNRLIALQQQTNGQICDRSRWWKVLIRRIFPGIVMSAGSISDSLEVYATAEN